MERRKIIFLNSILNYDLLAIRQKSSTKLHQKRKQKSQLMDSLELAKILNNISSPFLFLKEISSLFLFWKRKDKVNHANCVRESTLGCSRQSYLVKNKIVPKIYPNPLSTSQNSKLSKKLRSILGSTSSYKVDVIVSVPFVLQYKSAEDTSIEVLKISPERYKSSLTVEEKKRSSQE